MWASSGRRESADFGSNFAAANLARGMSNAGRHWNLAFVHLARDSERVIGSRGPGATGILLVHVSGSQRDRALRGQVHRRGSSSPLLSGAPRV
jgi:hypothetical protein